MCRGQGDGRGEKEHFERESQKGSRNVVRTERLNNKDPFRI